MSQDPQHDEPQQGAPWGLWLVLLGVLGTSISLLLSQQALRMSMQARQNMQQIQQQQLQRQLAPYRR
jgi:hypothetical protein